MFTDSLAADGAADAAAELAAICANHPLLGVEGFGTWRPGTRDEQLTRLAERRAEMLAPRSLTMFTQARAWLAPFPKRRAVDRRCNAYWLKHLAAPDIGYAFVGSFVAGAISAGFVVVPVGWDACVNVGHRDLRAVTRRLAQPDVLARVLRAMPEPRPPN